MHLARVVVFVGFVWCAASSFAQEGAATTYAFENGHWFDGEAFVDRTMYVVDGVFADAKPSGEVETVDLKSGFVVPPFGEAHNHNVDAGATQMIQRYLRDGIFYVKNPNCLPSDRSTLIEDGRVNTPRTLDVIFANGGLTATNGHPIQIAKRNIDNGYWDESDGEGGFYHTIDTESDLASKWPTIVTGHPDFIKTYLLYSEEFAKRDHDPEFDYWKGLDPALLPKIVAKAHADGLRVSTHIETAADFHNALVAGVDEVNHTPGFRPQPGIPLSRYEIADEVAALAAKNGVFVVTTLFGAHKPEVRELHARNLRTLKQHGVTIAVGSDAHRFTSVSEANYLHRLEVFSNAELLKMWCQDTAACIFPERKIGRLVDGYEASFIVLDGNPIDDFKHTRDITMRVKQGVILNEEPS